ncbi:MAG: hypothetical protein J3Q66DRAFT_330235 [Benniella sp.]|nr:MAG: hypothetical protein J3Q66DRAFT_330235 [Benniella sp.]
MTLLRSSLPFTPLSSLLAPFIPYKDPFTLDMGVAGLTKVVKSTEGTLANDLTMKRAHIDFLSVFFPLIQAHCFHVTSNMIAKEAGSLAAGTAPRLPFPSSSSASYSASSSSSLPCVQTVTSSDQAFSFPHPTVSSSVILSTSDVPASSSSISRGRKRQAASSCTPVKRRKASQNILGDIKQQCMSQSSLFIGSDGRITPNAPAQNYQTYRYVARRVDAILGPSFDKSRTTIHCDGETPPAQKSDERSRRKECLERQLKALTAPVEKVSIKKGAPASTYFKCKAPYRAPRTAIDEILDGLSKLDWKVCRCDFQADTHIADQCQKDPNNADIVVITKDSDLLVYEHIHSITIPIGRAHELTTFTKANVMSSLELPSARHLLLAALLSKNDYSSSIPRYTLQKNARIVQGIDLDAGSSHSIPTDSVKDAIRKYLERAETPHSRTPEHYKHAISAFVECREDRSDSATPSTSTHDQICALLRSLEMKKLARRASRSSPADPSLSSTAPQQREPLQPYNG